MYALYYTNVQFLLHPSPQLFLPASQWVKWGGLDHKTTLVAGLPLHFSPSPGLGRSAWGISILVWLLPCRWLGGGWQGGCVALSCLFTAGVWRDPLSIVFRPLQSSSAWCFAHCWPIFYKPGHTLRMWTPQCPPTCHGPQSTDHQVLVTKFIFYRFLETVMYWLPWHATEHLNTNVDLLAWMLRDTCIALQLFQRPNLPLALKGAGHIFPCKYIETE